jgi:hypothetical protein
MDLGETGQEGIIWLRIETSGGILLTFGFYKILGNSWAC